MGRQRIAWALVLGAAPLAAGCASDGPVRPEVPYRSQVARPAEPEGLADLRAALADRRAETRSAMDAATIRPTTLSESPTEPWYGEALDFLTTNALDALSLHFLGFW